MSEEQPTEPRGNAWPAGVPLGRVLGVPLIVSPFWFLLAAVVTVLYAPAIRDQVPRLSSTESYLVALSFFVLLYASVLVHEMSHVAVAKGLGMQVRRIVLQLLGGVSEVVEEQPGSARREYLVAVAGPMTSLFLAACGYAVRPVFADGSVARLLADGFAYTNLIIAGFNALPGLPLDGGRVLRALVWQVTHDKVRGTLAAGWVGRGLAIAVVIVPAATSKVFGHSTVANLWFVVIGFFLWSNASLAITQARVSSVLPRLDVRGMTRRALPVAADVPVAEAVRRANESGSRALVVVDGNGRPQGLVSEAAVSAMPPQRQPWVSISDLARPVDGGVTVTTEMNGEALLEAVQRTPATEYLVVDGLGAVVGVLARTDLVSALQAAGLH